MLFEILTILAIVFAFILLCSVLDFYSKKKIMLDWKKVEDELPKDNDLCLLCGENGFMQGPIRWRDGMWINLFGPMSSSEAGITITPDTPGLEYWAIVNKPF